MISIARPFEQRDLAAVAGLLAGRQVRDAARLPGLNRALCDFRQCERVLAATYLPEAECAVFEREGNVTGFLIGQRRVLDEDDAEPGTVALPVLGHAVHSAEDAAAAYRAMFAALAERWVADGFATFSVNVVAGDMAVESAWFRLGFGQKTTAAVRETTPLSPLTPTTATIRHATMDDLDDVCQLLDSIVAIEEAAPVFAPAGIDAAVRREQRAKFLADAGSPHFLAIDGGIAAGIAVFTAPGNTPWHLDRRKAVSLQEAATDPAWRGGGIGSALLAHGLEWAKAQGFERCILHFASANPTGGPFWLGHGFVPVGHQLVRRLDPRVLGRVR